eukprot:4677839-Prorocentrum_lima.AAC.1
MYTHQAHYVPKLSEIDTKSLNNAHPDELCNEGMHERYHSLPGALAWSQMSRADIAPFIGHLQRYGHQLAIGI